MDVGERTCYLAVCPECDLRVSIAAATCPECEADLDRRIDDAHADGSHPEPF
jgi:ribosomal protein L40E